jgi:hypothetical protein
MKKEILLGLICTSFFWYDAVENLAAIYENHL